MNVVVGSAFRNCEMNVRRFFNQVDSLRGHLGRGHSLRVIAAEGDSIDQTRHRIEYEATTRQLEMELVDNSHGGPMYGSVTDPARMKQLSGVGNSIFDAVKDFDSILVYVESDLCWDAHTMHRLINNAWDRESDKNVFAPMIFAGEHFYDIWAFRKNGIHFSPFKPYHPELRQGITELDSAGSCLVMRANIARETPRMSEGALVEWCENTRGIGYKVAVNSHFVVSHPC